MLLDRAQVCILAPTKKSATRLGEVLALPSPPRWISTAEEIACEDDLIFVTDWPRRGVAMCAATRAHTTAPIIVLSGDPSSKATVEMLGAGADLVLPQDIDPSELRARIRALLRRQRALSTVDAFHAFRLSDSAL